MKRLPLAVLLFALSLLPALCRAQAPAGIGVNLDAVVYDGTERPFANEWLHTGQPGTYANAGVPLAASQVNPATGVPTVPFASYAHWYAPTPTTYTVSYTGDADVSLGVLGTAYALQNVTRVNGVTRGTVTISNPGNNLGGFNVSRNNPANPIANIDVRRAGVDPSATFNPDFLGKLQKIPGPLRLMDWYRNNDQTSLSRVPLTAPQTTRAGVSWEYGAKLAKELNRDLWVNIPYATDSATLAAFGKALAANMPAGRTVYDAFDNEIGWNGVTGHAGPVYQAAQSSSLPTAPASDGYSRARQYIAAKGDEFTRALQAQGVNAKMVLEGQAADSSWIKGGLDFIAQKYGAQNVKSIVGATAIAPYSSLYKPGEEREGYTLDQLFAALQGDNVDVLAGWIKSNAEASHSYGVPLGAYESGQGLDGTYGSAAAKKAAQSDPRMATLLRGLYSQYRANGMDGPLEAFSFAGVDSGNYYWALLQDVADPGSVKWDAMLQAIAADPLSQVGPSVPEPASLALLAFAGVLLRRNRRTA